MSYRQIAARLAEERPYSLSHVCIGDDVQLLLKRWRAEQLDNVDDRLAAELQRLAQIEREAWRGWERSLEDSVTHVTEERTGDIDGATDRTTRTGQAGDPRFLQTVEKCVSRRCELLGLSDHVVNIRLGELEAALGIETG